MVRAGQSSNSHTNQEWYEALVEEAIRIHEEDRMLSLRIGQHGRSLIREGCGGADTLQCGAAQSSDYGTATAPMYLAHKDGVHFRVYADETRPLLQGARLTSFELFTAASMSP